MDFMRLLAISLCGLILNIGSASAQGSEQLASHEARAQQYLKSRQPDLALKEFLAVVAAEPNNLDAQANLGVLLYFAGKTADAEPHLQKALELAPGQSKIQALLGFCERRNGQPAAAAQNLRAALPGLTEPKIKKQAGLELIELDTASGDLADASATAALLKAALPSDPEVLYAAYNVNSDAAGEAMLELSLAAPDSPQMHQAIARELVRARENSNAIANLKTALDKDPHLPGARYELAQLLAASSDVGQKAEAKKQYELAIADNPSDDKSLTQLGDLEAAANDHKAAMADYRKALALQPENADAAIGLAHELVETNDLQAALPLLLQVIKADTSNVLAHYRLSVLYRRLHRADDAKREVAEYERLKAAHDKLRNVYQSLRTNSPMADDDKK